MSRCLGRPDPICTRSTTEPRAPHWTLRTLLPIRADHVAALTLSERLINHRLRNRDGPARPVKRLLRHGIEPVIESTWRLTPP